MIVRNPFHPSRRALMRFASREATGHRSPVARHLTHCARCREFVGFAQRLSKTAASLPGIPPNDDLLLRALEHRRDGMRIILPTPDVAPSSRRRVTPGVAALVVAAAAVAFTWLNRHSGPDVASVNELVLAGFVPRAAEARSMPRAGTAITHQLVPMSLTYAKRIRAPGAGKTWTPAGELSVRVAYDGRADAWLLTSSWSHIDGVVGMENARAWTETLRVAGPRLAPVTRAVDVVPYRRFAGISIRQRYHDDSVVGQMRLAENTTRRPIAGDFASYRDRLMASDLLGPFFFMGVPLASGASFDIGLLGWAVVPNDVILPLQMQVIGADSIDTPMGVCDCLKVAVSFAGRVGYDWLRRRDHLGILTRRELPDGSMREISLVREAQP